MRPRFTLATSAQATRTTDIVKFAVIAATELLSQSSVSTLVLIAPPPTK